MVHERCKIVSNEELEPGIFRLVVENDEMARSTVPGQFASLYLNSESLLLPRPLSICDAKGGLLTFIYRIEGKGTEILSKMKRYDTLRITGPSGNGFDLSLSVNKRTCVLGGGIGVLPLVMLTKRLNNADCYLGFRTESVLSGMFKDICENVYISSDDGSVGFHGNAAEMLKSSGNQYDVIYACGPPPLLRAAVVIAGEMGARCQISVEERMACGIGACMGCAFPVKTENGFTYKRVCADGPVFDGRDVYMDEFR